MFVVMNRITVNEGRGPDLEASFSKNLQHVKEAPGFIEFNLLRPSEGNTYISMAFWERQEDFDNWVQSEAFEAGHRRGTPGVVASTVLETYETAV